MTFTDDLWNGGDDLPELGVVVLGARLYDPTLQRFLQRDPIINGSGSSRGNPYSFAFNDPINYVDPTGLEGDCYGQECQGYDWGVGIAVAVGFAVLSELNSRSALAHPIPDLRITESTSEITRQVTAWTRDWGAFDKYERWAGPTEGAAPWRSDPCDDFACLALNDAIQDALLSAKQSLERVSGCITSPKLFCGWRETGEDLIAAGKSYYQLATDPVGTLRAAGQGDPWRGLVRLGLPMLAGTLLNGPPKIPTLRISRSKYPDLAENIWQAQQAGHPDVLTHGGDAAVNRAAALDGVPNVRAGIFSRDEYPFASSREGGRGAWVGHIPVVQQWAQGALIKNFIRANNIKPGMTYRVIVVP